MPRLTKRGKGGIPSRRVIERAILFTDSGVDLNEMVNNIVKSLKK